VPREANAEALLDGLTQAQRAAVLSDAQPLCILAAAGAGKTRVLTRRIAYRSAAGACDPRHVLALTFTRKAATELRHRLSSLGLREPLASGTFHSVAAAQLQRWWADRRQPAPSLLDRKSRLLAPLATRRPGLAKVPVAELAGHIEWARARLITPEEFEDAVEHEHRSLPRGVPAASLAAVYARYEHEKRRRGLVDFDDLLAGCAEAIERDPDFAAAQRWRWRHIFVDEFQDLNPLQHRLLLAWLGPSVDLCVVGDPHQAIYGWNGSDPALLDGMSRRWPSTTVLRLDANHRSTEQIVNAARSVLGGRGAHLVAAGREGPPPDATSWPDERAEASGIAAAIARSHLSGRQWGSMAVLARTNAQLLPIEAALRAAGVPVHCPARAAILEDPVAREAIRDLRDRGHLPARVAIADLEELSGRSAPDPLDDEARAALGALVDLALEFSAEEPGGTIARWLAWLPTATRDRSGPGGPSSTVTLCSFHRSKGLEWDAVWVAGLEEGLVPIGRATSRDQADEERRLLYVALTRASTELHCSWAQQRTFGGRRVPRDPSRWLAALTAVAHHREGEDADRLRGESWRAHLGEQKRLLRDAARSKATPRLSRAPGGYPEPDPDLADRIKAWRLETSRASGVPAYVILHDVTVNALAALRPTTRDELLSVPGLGPVKAGRYGPSLLEILRSAGSGPDIDDSVSPARKEEYPLRV
jgi:DNA helicase-2/ATP-dependent DNA helicase PcrA